MPLTDSRGRLFGVLNLIDAGVVHFVLVLVPIGFVTYRVFRVPDPQIDSVTPATQPPGPDRRIRLTGHDFRPYLRVFVNKTGEPFALVNGNPELTEGRFLTETPTLVEIKLPDLQPATYDLHVFDEGQQVAEKISAFTLSGGPPQTVDTVVHFVVSRDLVPLVTAGDQDTFVPSGPALAPSQPRATIKSAKVIDDKLAAIEVHAASQGGGAGLRQQGEMLEAIVAIPAVPGDTGALEYKRQPIRTGDTLKFETTRYAMFGVIGRVGPGGADQATVTKGGAK